MSEMIPPRPRHSISLAILVLAAVLLAGTLAPGCVVPAMVPPAGGPVELQNAAEVSAYLAAYTLPGEEVWGGGQDRRSSLQGVSALPLPVSLAAPPKNSPGSDEQSLEYSVTNVQERGVDEGDLLKNDGSYLYLINGDDLVIARAYPAEEGGIVSRTLLAGSPEALFLEGDRVAVISRATGHGGAVTKVAFYTVTDRSSPVATGEWSIDGEYFDSRTSGGVLVVITRTPVSGSGDSLPLPAVRDEAGSGGTARVFAFSHPETTFVFHTVATFRMADGRSLDRKTYLAGDGNTLYASPGNLFLAYPVDERAVRAEEVQPVLWGGLPQGTAVSAIPDEVTFNRMSEAEKAEVIARFRAPATTPVPARERISTVIHKIRWDGGDLSYQGRGEVKGSLLSRWSMSEEGGYLRVATTSQVYSPGRGTQESNNVLVLDSGMQVKGTLSGVAPGERIYAARFLGNRLYLVTFRRTDPFFVIDLSSPASPEVLGYLKIPGFSEYLHPYGNDYVLGFGRDTVENEWGGVTTGGLKIALFDVKDVTHPILRDEYRIGGQETDSEALKDPKALLCEPDRGLVVLPISRQGGYLASTDSEKVSSTLNPTAPPTWQRSSWQGVYVLSVSPEDGFALLGTISHSGNGTGYIAGCAIRRSVRIQDTLSTVSPCRIQVHSLSDLTTPLREIPLETGPVIVPVMAE